MFFDGWPGVLRVMAAGVVAYSALVLMLRVSGNRTLSKMNAFDLIVTVALGSTLATIALSDQVAVVEGLTALALLIGLQFVVTWLSSRSTQVSRLVTSEPTLLLYRGELLPSQLLRARVTEDDVRAAIRQQGIGAVEAVDAVVLETDGTFSVVASSPEPPTALGDLPRQANR